MQSFPALALITAIFLMVCLECQSLRCRTDDGPSEESIKKTIRICMHKVGENETNDEYSYEDNSDSEQNDDEITTRMPHNPSYSNGQYGNSGKFNPYTNLNGNGNGNAYNGGYDHNPYNNWNVSNSFGGMGIQRDYNTQFQNQYPQYPGYSNSFKSNKTSARKNQTEEDRACLVHCFFHELKMTNNEDFPDKRKMLQTLTKDIREQEVREFYVDSIQECFHMVDNMDNYNRRKNKCEVALTIIECLTERARTNCDDFRSDIMMF